MARQRAPVDVHRVMNVLRFALAGIVAVLGIALGTASAVAFYAGGYVFGACTYAGVGCALVLWSRRLRPSRRRYVFARR
jgi:hypothetical protein